MQRLLILPFLLMTLFFGPPASGADFQKGMNAYNQGDYVTTLKEWRPLAEQGHASAQYDPLDPQGLKPGMNATVMPTTDSGEIAVAGVIRATSRDTIALTIDSPMCGQVAVHFPRVGYRVSVVD